MRDENRDARTCETRNEIWQGEGSSRRTREEKQDYASNYVLNRNSIEMKTREGFGIGLKGLAMGIAEVIPGVSGGTIAFITNIYERLLGAIKSFDLSLISAARQGGFKGLWKHVDGSFLLSLFIGMGVGIIFGVNVITSILETYPEMLWAFFFGLIIASAIYIAKQIKNWSWVEWLLLIVGVLVAYIVTILTPVAGSTSYPYVFFAGMIAICALILPGVSGSFMLVLLGLYTTIIPLLKDFLETFDLSALSVLVVFGLGCITGLLSFARVVSFAFKKYHNQTLAILTGFMIGSLNKIWPWRNPLIGLDESGNFLDLDPANLPDMEHLKIVKELNVLPATYSGEPYILGVIVCALAGFALVFMLEYTQKKFN